MRPFMLGPLLVTMAIAGALAGHWATGHAAPAAPVTGTSSTEWRRHGYDAAETRFSPLSAINTGNVAHLGPAWHFRFDRPRGVEATPIMVDGTLYVSGPWGVVYALDARNGRPKWKHDPQVPAGKGIHACCDVVNRGVAVDNGRVFVATIDGRLQALDSRSGRLLWSTRSFDPARPYTITGAPRVVRDLVVIGNAGAEYGVRGFVSAYDAATGDLRWRFYTVPGNPADGPDSAVSDRPLRDLALPTWRGEWWRYGGGGTVWDAMAWDPDLDLLYFGVGNGSPHDRDVRSPGGGDNLFLSSIVAVRPATGEYVWHYQTTPGDSWDYTATQHMILTDLEIGGRSRKVLMQAPKNGFFYVLDRATGELLSADKYVPVNWASHVDLASGRPVENEGARYPTGKPFLVQPSQLGGHNWQPMAWSPLTGLVYIPAQENTGFMMKEPGFRFERDRWNTGVLNPPMPPDPAVLKQARDSMRGHLLAWDPVRRTAVWRTPHASSWNGGVLATAGNLVFQGVGGGGLAAFDARDGRRLWQSDTWLDIVGGPISYELDGQQYIAAAAGFGSSIHLTSSALLPRTGAPVPGGLFVWKLGGKAAMPHASERPTLPPPPDHGSDADVGRGAMLYARYCMQCHGAGAMAGGGMPDLRHSPYLADAALFSRPLLEGILAARGMPDFRDTLRPEDTEAIRAYVVRMAHVMSGEAGTR
ncbi:MAG: PQQ-dependent dehydrogenase, methanol/ethanol family [Proteobacteria bacterium]|nr:PQQ-dependent dehydrogenase, methanol/ethanol family [Pseudomonadota bacterium]MBS0555722.1 PQQ-dependent dehydrogenase, methanol/ethanol family [Pseudomonadota bacterium]